LVGYYTGGRAVMVRRMAQVCGAVAAVALVVVALWGWGQAWRFAENAHRPNVTVWAVRSGAVAAVAAAQVLVITCAIGALYRRRPLDEMLRLLAGLVATIALVSAIALALAGR
jgi:hypothetical protein